MTVKPPRPALVNLSPDPAARPLPRSLAGVRPPHVVRKATGKNTVQHGGNMQQNSPGIIRGREAPGAGETPGPGRWSVGGARPASDNGYQIERGDPGPVAGQSVVLVVLSSTTISTSPGPYFTPVRRSRALRMTIS